MDGCVEDGSSQVPSWDKWMACGVLHQARQLRGRTRLDRDDVFHLGQVELNVLLRYLSR